MDILNKSKQLRIMDFHSAPMRAFHMSWFAFFICFFAWFGIVPFMGQIKTEWNLSKEQIGTLIAASISITIFARIITGKACETYGPRLTYTFLMIISAIPVALIAFSQNYEQFFWCRLAIGVVGASFVVTQVHTSMMFAPNCVGTANATAAGWGNIGGGAVAVIMPYFAKYILEDTFGISHSMSWRAAMLFTAFLLIMTAIAYFFMTQDTPDGNLKDLKDALPAKKENKDLRGSFMTACTDTRVWALFILYGACFGVELTVYNTMADHLVDRFKLGIGIAGSAVAAFALMNLFARTLGGYFGDKFGMHFGLRGRVLFLGALIVFEGIFLFNFTIFNSLQLAIVLLVLFSLFVQAAEGATFTVVPFINKKCLGSVSGIVGAGGNAGALVAALVMKHFEYGTGYMLLAISVTISGLLVLKIKFSPEAEADARKELEPQILKNKA